MPNTSHGPIIQPMSVTQYRSSRFAARRSQCSHVLRGLDRKAAVGVHGALGPAGRARGVDDHQRIFGVGPFRFRFVALSPDLIPPQVATRSPRNHDPKPREQARDGPRETTRPHRPRALWHTSALVGRIRRR